MAPRGAEGREERGGGGKDPQLLSGKLSIKADGRSGFGPSGYGGTNRARFPERIRQTNKPASQI